MLYVVDFSIYEVSLNNQVLTYGYVAMFCAIYSFCLGYILIGGAHLKSYRLRVTFGKISIYYALIFLSVTLLFFYYRYMGVFNNPLQPIVSRFYITINDERSSLTFLTIGADILYVIFLFKIARVKNISQLSFVDWFFILIPIFTNLITTNRGSIILYVFGALCVRYSLEKARFPYIKFLVFVIVVVGALGLARGITQSEEQLKTTDFKYSTVFTKTAEHILERPYHLAIDKTSFIISEVSQRDLYLYGASLVTFIVAPIPRLIWPEKPNVSIGPWVAKEIYNRHRKSGVPPGFIAELFLNFSWLVLFLVCLFMGLSAD